MTRRVVRGRRRAAGRTIVAYRRGDGTATNYEIARVTVALQHLRAKDHSRARIDPVQRRLYTYGSAGAISPLADQPSHGGVLARRGVRLHPVPRAQHPQHLIIGGATEGVIRPGGLVREPGQLRAAGHGVHQHPGGELRGPTQGYAGQDPRPVRGPQEPVPSACTTTRPE